MEKQDEKPTFTLFGYFVIALNAAFTQQLSLADEGYKSGSDTIDLPTPLWKTPCIHHVSSLEHASFNPVNTAPHSTVTITPCTVHHKLLPDQCTAVYPSAQILTIPQTALQHVPTAQMKRKKIFRWYLWMTSTGPLKNFTERTFCIHEHGLPHNLHQYPCSYGSNDTVSYMDSLDVSDISDYEDYLVTSSDEELPGLKEVPY